MRRICIVIFVFSVMLPGCKKDSGPRYSGTDTINNTLYGTGPYYVYGFSVPAGQKVKTSSDPPDVITINAFPGNFDKTYFDVRSLTESFYRYGVYPDEASASLAFKNLTSASVTQWKATGDSVRANQIWLFRTSINTYAKFRIKSTVGEIRGTRPYVECTFEWVYQPDKSLTFPAK